MVRLRRRRHRRTGSSGGKPCHSCTNGVRFMVMTMPFFVGLVLLGLVSDMIFTTAGDMKGALHHQKEQNITSSKVHHNQQYPHQDYTVTAAILVNPETSKELMSNLFRSLQTGQDASRLDQSIVFYDARQNGTTGFSNLLRDLVDLSAQGVISKYIEVQWNRTVADIFGVADVNFHDGSLYATHQYLVHECETDYCAYFNSDIFMHQGGGLAHAVRILQENPTVAFALPPLAWDFTDPTPDLRHTFKDAEGNVPYMTEVRPIRLLTNATAKGKGTDASSPRCQAAMPGLSTRYYVAVAERFVQTFHHFQPSTVPVLEQQPAFRHHRLAVHIDCRGSQHIGFVLHVPPWHMGKRLLESCSVKDIQKAVDAPESLAIDEFNNMIEESWTDAAKLLAIPS